MISIPFTPEMEKAVLEGRKCCTTRRKKYGNPGDLFRINQNDGFTYRIIAIQRKPLGVIGQFLFQLEGCSSPEDFKRVWLEIHKKWNPNEFFNVHYFARCS